MFRSLGSRAGLAVPALVVALLGAGCALTVPKSDSTPPKVALTVTGLGTTFTVDSASGPVTRTAPAGAQVGMLGVGTDADGGVKNIRIDGEANISCESGELGQAISILYLSQNPEDPEVGPGDEARDRRLTTLGLKIDDLKGHCKNGFQFLSLSGSFVATAENFHGGTASTPAFTFTHP